MGGEIKEPGTSMKVTSTGLETKAWATHLARGACVGKGGVAGAGKAAGHREGSGLGRGPGRCQFCMQAVGRSAQQARRD